MQVQGADQPPEAMCDFARYTGSGDLEAGDVLCRDPDQSEVDDRVTRVMDPSGSSPDNLDEVAGFVHPAHGGKSGPCVVKLVKSGYTDVQVDVSAAGEATVSEGTLLYPQDGSRMLGGADSKSSSGATTDLTVERGCAKLVEAADADGRFKAMVNALGPKFTKTSTA